jgi:hypothetical protein
VDVEGMNTDSSTFPKAEAQAPRSNAGASNTCSPTVALAGLPSPEVVENRWRSIAMLPPGAPALNGDETLELLGHLERCSRYGDSVRRNIAGQKPGVP